MRARSLSTMMLRAPEGETAASAGTNGADGAAAAAAAAAAGGAGANGAGANGAGADWTATLSPEAKALAGTKGWKAPADVFKSYMEIEKTLGADKAALPPKNEKGERDWSKFDWTALGRPDKPEAYAFQDGEGVKVDPKMDGWYRGVAHKAGLNAWQAQVLRGEWNQFAASLNSGHAETVKAEMAAAESELRTELGTAFDAKLDLANRVIAQFGDAELVKELEATGLGRKTRLVRALAKIGEQFAEAGILKGEQPSGGALDPATAKAEIAAMEGNEATFKILNDKNHPEYAAMNAKRARLYVAAYPEEKAS